MEKVTLKCHFCNKEFERPLSHFNARKKNGQKKMFCSKECTLKNISKCKKSNFSPFI